MYKAVLAHPLDATSYALKLARRPDEPRFAREAEMLSRLRHPSVPHLHSTGVYADEHGRSFPFLVMQFISGTNLYDWARGRPLSLRQVLGLLAQVARALEATHQHGLHRDVKGDNVLVREDGHAVLLDFGACWLSDVRPLTDTVIPPGTEPYRSPQIVRFRQRHWGEEGVHYRFQPEDDLYALGVMAFYLITGAYPSSAADVEHIEALISPMLARLLRRLLSDEPSQRGTVRALAEETEQAATSLGSEGDMPVVAPLTPPRLEPVSPREPPRACWERPPVWALARRVAVVQALGMAGLLSGGLALLTAPFEAQLAQGSNRREDKVDLGSTALSPASPDSAGLAEERRAVSAKVPGTPLPGQRRPPCEKGIEEIHKGCWGRVPTVQPPCPQGLYEWRESCYAPILGSERAPTSEDP